MANILKELFRREKKDNGSEVNVGYEIGVDAKNVVLSSKDDKREAYTNLADKLKIFNKMNNIRLTTTEDLKKIGNASGELSHAEGLGTIANGKYQHVQGKYNVEDTVDSDGYGQYVHIVGWGDENQRKNIHTIDKDGNTEFAGSIKGAEFIRLDGTSYANKTIYDDNAISVGRKEKDDNGNVISKGKNSIAYGENLIASGNNSIAFGQSCTVTGMNSRVEGYGCNALAECTHVEGGNNTANKNAPWSHVEGFGCMTENENCHAEGYQTISAGHSCHTEGVGTKTYTYGSHAEGQRTHSGGRASHAEGYSSTRYDNVALAELPTSMLVNDKKSIKALHDNAKFTLALGRGSHAEGEDTLALGVGSHSEGLGTISEQDYQHVQGKYNIADTENRYAHIVGGGTSDTDRKNIYTVDWDGNVTKGIGHNPLSISNCTVKDSSINISFNGSEFTGEIFLLKNFSYDPQVKKWALEQGGFNENDSIIQLTINNIDKVNYVGKREEFFKDSSKLFITSSALSTEWPESAWYQKAIMRYSSYSYNIYIFIRDLISNPCPVYHFDFSSNEYWSLRAPSLIEGNYSKNKYGNYAHIIGGGSSSANRKNIYELDWDGNAEFAGDIKFTDSNKQQVSMQDLLDRIVALENQLKS